MNKLADWILCGMIVFGVLCLFAYDDGMEDQQKSAQVEREAVAQYKAEKKAALHARIEAANGMLSLEAVK